MPSAKTEDYLDTVYEGRRASHGSVSTSRVTGTLDVTPSTATNVLEGLEEREHVEHRVAGVRGDPGLDPYGEVTDA